MSKKWTLAAVVCGVLLALCMSDAIAGERGQRGERGERGEGGRRFDPEAMRTRMNEFYKQRLGVTDEEWQVIQPRFQKVQELTQQLQGRRGFGGRTRPQPNAEGEQPEVPAIEQARQKLEELLGQENPPAAEVKAALTAYREAKEAVKEELAEAQEELRELLTVQQEAQMVLMGLLE